MGITNSGSVGRGKTMAISNSGSVGRGKMNTKQVIVLRKDLNMRKGKCVAQGCHASMKAILDVGQHVDSNFVLYIDPILEDWLMGIFTKVCVSVNSEEELLDIYKQAKDNGLYCSLIQDAGLTEFGGVPTYTAVAVGPGYAEEINKITGHLKLL